MDVKEHIDPRGAASDRFNAAEMGKKQHQYHRLIFEKVYREIPIAEIFGDLSAPEHHLNALVERMWMMGKGLLVVQVREDLELLKNLLESNPNLDLEAAAESCLTFLVKVFKEKGHASLSETMRSILVAHTHENYKMKTPVGAAIWDSVEVSFS
ncbi:MAG: hypothetical protein CME25_14760 [Gemmatimonadetes bacterium]|nr:hypothetical protein [Gemmatimonadota bacterium]